MTGQATPPSADRAARIAFFGSGVFGVPILEALASLPGIDLIAVVSVPDRPAGRSAAPTPPPVVIRARELGLTVLQLDRLRDSGTAADLSALDLDAAVLADYGRLIPPALLSIPRRGFLNVHPSALPRHRGATPIQATILAGDPETAVTLFEVEAGLDTGPIVAQAAWSLRGDETAPALEADAARRGAVLLRETLGPWLAGRVPSRPQSTAGVTLTRPLSREDGRLDAAQPAAALERRVRALTPWPGTFVETDGDRLLVLAASAAPSEPADTPGHLAPDADGLALTTAAGRLRLLEVRPAGGRSMSAVELRRGRPRLAGAAVLAHRDVAARTGSSQPGPVTPAAQPASSARATGATGAAR
jgi:methionyl-tRNA formyltransferase